MQCDQLHTKEVIARGDAGWNGKGMLSLVRNHFVDGPSGAGKPVLINLEPLETGDRRRQGVVNLGKVSHKRTLV